jgi:hypothetical protein
MRQAGSRNRYSQKGLLDNEIIRRNKTAAIAIEAKGARRRRFCPMIRKLQSGEYRLYSRKANPKTGKRRNLGTFKSRAAAEKHERAVQYFKRH